MGYYSDWGLTLEGQDQDVKKTLAWMRRQSRKNQEFKYMLERRLDDPHPPEVSAGRGLVVLHDTGDKCYEDWSQAVDKLFDYCDAHAVAITYCRVGENMDDNESRVSGQEGAFRMYMDHHIDLSDAAPWFDDRLQFERLITALGPHIWNQPGIMELVADDMGVSVQDVESLLDRACKNWQVHKYRVRQYVKKEE